MSRQNIFLKNVIGGRAIQLVFQLLHYAIHLSSSWFAYFFAQTVHATLCGCVSNTWFRTNGSRAVRRLRSAINSAAVTVRCGKNIRAVR
jgi:hypothetical protein